MEVHETACPDGAVIAGVTSETSNNLLLTGEHDTSVTGLNCGPMLMLLSGFGRSGYFGNSATTLAKHSSDTFA